MSIPVGINGFGRIGKCTFLQLLESPDFSIKAINTSFALTSIEQYINNDSVHGPRKYKVHIIDENHIQVKNQVIQILNSRVPGPTLPFRACGVKILFETTGAFLTTPKMNDFDVDYVILSAPPKDIGTTPMYCYGVNERDYAGEKVISVASCTTNCLAPFLAAAQSIAGGVKEGNFLTVHAATASQSVTDTANDKTRTSRSIFNNMIPHSTGASKTVDWLIPELKGKLKGTSLRVPVSNVSMVDVNLRFHENIEKEVFLSELAKCRCPDVVKIHKGKSVSGDFIGSTASSIVDFHQSFQLTPDSIKFCLWYDNEWSFTSNMIHMGRLVHKKSCSNTFSTLSDINCFDKTVLLRCDFNPSFSSFDGSFMESQLKDKIDQILPSINQIRNQKPKQLIIGAYIDRPFLTANSKQEPNLESLVPILSQGLFSGEAKSNQVKLMSQGDNKEKCVYFLINNLHDDDDGGNNNDLCIDILVTESLQPLGVGVIGSNAPIKCLGLKTESDLILTNEMLKVEISTCKDQEKIKVAVIGGESPSAKVPMIHKLAETFDVILMTPKMMKAVAQDSIGSTSSSSLSSSTNQKKAEFIVLDDGFEGTCEDDVTYVRSGCNKETNLSDIGPKSLNKIAHWVDKADVVLWNGTMGKVENEFFASGSENLIYLLKRCRGQVYVGGDRTRAFANKHVPGEHFNHLSLSSVALSEYVTTGTLPEIPYNT